MSEADAVYGYRPWQSNAERLVSDSLQAALTGTAQAQLRVLFPPQFGYPNNIVDIFDVMQLDNRYPGAQVNYAGKRSGIPTTSFPDLGTM